MNDTTFPFSDYPEALYAIDIGSDDEVDALVRELLDTHYGSATYAYRWLYFSGDRAESEATELADILNATVEHRPSGATRAVRESRDDPNRLLRCVTALKALTALSGYRESVSGKTITVSSLDAETLTSGLAQTGELFSAKLAGLPYSPHLVVTYEIEHPWRVRLTEVLAIDGDQHHIFPLPLSQWRKVLVEYGYDLAFTDKVKMHLTNAVGSVVHHCEAGEVYACFSDCDDAIQFSMLTGEDVIQV